MQNLFDDLVELKDNYLPAKVAMLQSASQGGLTKTAQKAAAPAVPPLDAKALVQEYGLPTIASLLAYLYATSQKEPYLPAVAGLPAAAFLATKELQKSPSFQNVTLDRILGAQWGTGGPQIMPLLAAAALGYLVMDKLSKSKE